MKMNIGPEMTRGIIIKQRKQLKAALAEHEVLAGDKEHMALLNEMIKKVEYTNQHTKFGKMNLDHFDL